MCVCAFVGHIVTLLVQQRSDLTRILIIERMNEVSSDILKM